MANSEVVRQSDFSFGEISDEYAASDSAAKVKSLKKGKNLRILNSYGVGQRYGSRRMATVVESVAIDIITTDGTEYLGVIRAAGADIYSQDGSLVQSVGSAPWVAADLSGLTYYSDADVVYFAHKSYWPRTLTLTAGTWAFALLPFDGGAGGSSLQPYFRFAAKGITVTPSDVTGTISVVFSSNVLTAAHVGVRFRYGARADSLKEFQITVVADGTHGTALVLDTLPPTYVVTVADGSGYRVGEDVQGSESGAAGIVTAISTNDVTVLMANGYESFLITGFGPASTDGENLVGPFTSSLVSAASVTTPGATTVWDEAAISPARGYPGDVFVRTGRLGFADFPLIPAGITLSAPGAPNDFDVGKAEADDAIFYLLQDGGQRIKFCASAANLIIHTDKKVYYVPEDENTPLAANTFAPIEVGPTGISQARPLVVEAGVVFVEIGGNRVMGLLSTGDVTSPYQLTDLSRHAAHLIKNPLNLAMTNGNSQAPERYIFALNEDGTLACIFYDTNPPRLGVTPWETDGEWSSMVTVAGIVYAICSRSINGSTVYLLERLDADAQMDASSLFSDDGAFLSMVDDDETGPTNDDGVLLSTDTGALPHLAGETIKVIRGTEYLGEFMVGADGSIGDLGASTGDFEGGLHFDIDTVLWPPESVNDQRTMFQRRRIVAAAVRTQDSGPYTIGIYGRDLVNLRPAYDQGDDLSAAPPLRTEVKRWPLSGYEYEPSVQILRPIPQPLTILSVAQELSVPYSRSAA